MAQGLAELSTLVKANTSVVAAQAIQRIAWLYKIEANAKELTPQGRLQMQQERVDQYGNRRLECADLKPACKKTSHLQTPANTC